MFFKNLEYRKFQVNGFYKNIRCLCYFPPYVRSYYYKAYQNAVYMSITCDTDTLKGLKLVYCEDSIWPDCAAHGYFSMVNGNSDMISP